MTLVYLKIPREILRHVPKCATSATATATAVVVVVDSVVVFIVNEEMALLRTRNVLLFEIDFQCNPK